MFQHRHLLGIQQLSSDEILEIINRADDFLEVSRNSAQRLLTLQGKTVINVFLESSTRTRTSFEIAAKRLSADVLQVASSGSSLSKGETLLDTARTLNAMNPEMIVLRHSSSGAAHWIAQHVSASVVNAGDGMHEHPTQALLDCATIRKHKHTFAGLIVTIVGDIAHSRVARSNIHALRKLGATVRVAAPMTLMPAGIETLGVQPFFRVEDALKDADVILVLRLQQERQEAGLIPSTREYSRYFGINASKLSLAKSNAIVMHPGPINRGVEIAPDVADGPHSVILEQVTYGIAVRMAVLDLLMQARSVSSNSNKD